MTVCPYGTVQYLIHSSRHRNIRYCTLRYLVPRYRTGAPRGYATIAACITAANRRMPQRSQARRELLIKCTPRKSTMTEGASSHHSTAATYCVKASPNPEFASQPSNYAHWLLAHLFPLLSQVLNTEDRSPIAQSRLYIAHGSNTVLPIWIPRYIELFGFDCSRSSALLALDRLASSSVNDGEFPWQGLGCQIHLNVSVRMYAFCSRKPFWDKLALKQVARFIRERLGMHTIPFDRSPRTLLASNSILDIRKSLTRRVVVLLRQSKDGYRSFWGLERACEPAFTDSAISRGVLSEGTHVECAGFNMSTSLKEMAQMVGSPDTVALISGHGAGQANILFMPRGSTMAEFDSIKNIGRARNFYQYLAAALDVRATKVWLNVTGARFCPPRTNACGAGNMNMYRASVRILPDILDQVMNEVTSSGTLRDCGIMRDQEGLQMFRARVAGWGRLDIPMYHRYTEDSY